MIEHYEKLKDIVNNLEGILDKDIRSAEKEVDKIEEQLKVALRQHKNDKRKECQNTLAKAELKLETLTDAISNI